MDTSMKYRSRAFLVVILLLISVLLLAVIFPPDEEGVKTHVRNKDHLDGTAVRQFQHSINSSGFINTHHVGQESAKLEVTSNEQAGAEDQAVCDMECWRFQDLLRTWPAEKPKAAVYYLTRPSQLRFLIRSLDLLHRYFTSQYQYPVIVFHERDFRQHRQQILAVNPTADIYFQEVHFELPSFLKEPVEVSIPCLSHIGYRHMCRFQAKMVYEHPIMQGLDYYWRLDDDSFVFGPVTYDVFRYMHNHQVAYGYTWIHYDSFKCTKGLWEATDHYIKSHGMIPTFFADWPSPKIYYNNFEIASLSLWQSEQYRDYVNYIDKLGGIYYTRWGDAPIKGIAVSLFLHRNQTHHFRDIPYQHASFNSSKHTWSV